VRLPCGAAARKNKEYHSHNGTLRPGYKGHVTQVTNPSAVCRAARWTIRSLHLCTPLRRHVHNTISCQLHALLAKRTARWTYGCPKMSSMVILSAAVACRMRFKVPWANGGRNGGRAAKGASSQNPLVFQKWIAANSCGISVLRVERAPASLPA
jgi:hypothetical protein